METPSSTRRMTRSQTLAASAGNANSPLSRKLDESEKVLTKSRAKNQKQQERSALIDITNDSPIVGVAMGNLDTPSSAMSKKRVMSHGGFSARTPGSGEALLRGQVKTLLQKVEEEAVLSRITLENRPLKFNLVEGFVSSPITLVAPTPANTPQVNDALASLTPSTLNEMMIAEMLNEKKEEDTESENMITRSLLLDFSEKSEPSDSSECSSVVTYQGVEKTTASCNMDDDNASIWSIQVNASSTVDDDEDEEEMGETDCFYSYYEQEGEGEEEEEEYGQDFGDDNGDSVDELCEGLSKISVKDDKFAGKHIRFVYNSDDEIEGIDECGDESTPSGGVLRLKGLPTPKGKHLRFQTTDDDADD